MNTQDVLEPTHIHYVIETPSHVGVSYSINDVKLLLENQGVNGYIKVAVCKDHETAAKVQRAILAQYTIAANVLEDSYEMPCLADDCVLFEKPTVKEPVARLVKPISFLG